MAWEADVKIAGPVGSMGQRVLQPIINQQVGNVLGALDNEVQAAKAERPCRVPARDRRYASPSRGPHREPGRRAQRGREAYARRAWLDAHERLTSVHGREPLEAPDLELLATTAFMLGRDDDTVAWLERAHQQYLDDGLTLPAVRCAAWIVMNLAIRGEIGPATRVARPSAAPARGRGRVRGARMAADPLASSSARRRESSRRPPPSQGRQSRSASGSATATSSRSRSRPRATCC